VVIDLYQGAPEGGNVAFFETASAPWRAGASVDSALCTELWAGAFICSEGVCPFRHCSECAQSDGGLSDKDSRPIIVVNYVSKDAESAVGVGGRS
jgi:hypothetical protein